MGAVAGTTHGGFGGFDVSSWEVWLNGDGEVNWDIVYMLGYKAINEMADKLDRQVRKYKTRQDRKKTQGPGRDERYEELTVDDAAPVM